MSRLRPDLLKPASRKRVLFVCIGNSCRSPMAEAFARTYGGDVMEAGSAGLYPAAMVAPLTRKILGERGISIEDLFPKSIQAALGNWDIIVNMSGAPLPGDVRATEVREWPVPDPVVDPEAVYRRVAGQIESLVMQLILELRDP